MLSVMYGVLAMTPITFGIAGYVLVSRDGPSITHQLETTTELTTQRAKDVDSLTD